MASPAVDRPPRGLRLPTLDVAQRPFLVLFELTRACDLACRHCRAEAIPNRHPDELSEGEVAAVLDDLAALGPPRPIVVLTGGDPFKRPDLTELVGHGAARGLAMAVSPSGTPLVTRRRLVELRRAGTRVVSFSIDGAGPAAHDSFRGVQGSHRRTLEACREAVEAGLRLQVNTTVTAGTVGELPGIVELVRGLGAGLWSVFFLVATGRGRELASLSAEQTEDVLHFLYDASALVPLKTTEAPQYRRVVAARAAGAASMPSGRGPLYRSLGAALAEVVERNPPRTRPRPRSSALPGPPAAFRPPLAVGEGRGVVFVSHTGEVSPSGFLPLVAGNVRDRPLTAIYRRAPLFRSLRDPGRLGGRCGRCELRRVCGGSRARAFATYGDPLAEDPGCPYVPGVTPR
jgi:radical SAM protein